MERDDSVVAERAGMYGEEQSAARIDPCGVKRCGRRDGAPQDNNSCCQRKV